jgi:hypothetical protein
MASLPDEVNASYNDVLAEYAEKYHPVAQKAAEPRKPAFGGPDGPNPAVANGAEARPAPTLYEDLLSTLFYDGPGSEDPATGGPLNRRSPSTEVDYEYGYDYDKETGYLSGEEGSEGEKYDDNVGPRSLAAAPIPRPTAYALGGTASRHALADIRDQLIDVDTSVATLEDRVIEIKDLVAQSSAHAEDNARRLEDLGRDVGQLRAQAGRIEATLATLVKILLEPDGLERAKQYAGSRK